ncbi:MAG TPA: hypothetical protein VKB25_07020 [Conexibacter sp.]|nr:hypothetical protein [Conexibacter sp.]
MSAELRTAPVLYVDDDTVECVINAPHGALILAVDDCGSCAGYEAEIRRLQDRELLGDLVVGKLVLTQPGSRAFKRSNQWLTTLDHLPYTVLYASGQRVDEFAASKGFFLMERAEGAGFI